MVYTGHEPQVRVLRDATKDRYAGRPKRSAYGCTALVNDQFGLSATGCTTPDEPKTVLIDPFD